MRHIPHPAVMISLCILWILAGSATNSGAEPEHPPQQKKKAMTPDKVLQVALKSLADAEITLWEDYEISMTRKKDKSQWVVWFVSLPKTPGADVTVFVEQDGKTSILLGK